jgi:hypothetical protein
VKGSASRHQREGREFNSHQQLKRFSPWLNDSKL